MLRRTAAPVLGESWARRRERVSRQIELATMRHFISKGVDKVTVEAAAEAAGVSRRTYYRYFPSPLDVVGELPRRGLARVAEKFRSRPISESLVDAYQAAIVPEQLSGEDLEIRTLSAEFMRRWPDVWHSLGRDRQAESILLYSEIIHERMIARGQDPAIAGVLAATLSAVTTQIYSEHGATGSFPVETIYGEVLRDLGRILCE
jgi:AcrR family transcriptional regulator